MNNALITIKTKKEEENNSIGLLKEENKIDITLHCYLKTSQAYPTSPVLVTNKVPYYLINEARV